ncbi:hypothetical protein LINPERPRIM_LOCUS23806 [Linum perenne]
MHVIVMCHVIGYVNIRSCPSSLIVIILPKMVGIPFFWLYDIPSTNFMTLSFNVSTCLSYCMYVLLLEFYICTNKVVF